MNKCVYSLGRKLATHNKNEKFGESGLPRHITVPCLLLKPTT